MLRHKSTGIQFENRKQAIKLVGQSRYNWLRKIDEWEFLNDTPKEKK